MILGGLLGVTIAKPGVTGVLQWARSSYRDTTYKEREGEKKEKEKQKRKKEEYYQIFGECCFSFPFQPWRNKTGLPPRSHQVTCIGS
jgi:hypothetical protein